MWRQDLEGVLCNEDSYKKRAWSMAELFFLNSNLPCWFLHSRFSCGFFRFSGLVFVWSNVSNDTLQVQGRAAFPLVGAVSKRNVMKHFWDLHLHLSNSNETVNLGSFLLNQKPANFEPNYLDKNFHANVEFRHESTSSTEFSRIESC